ncbi:uncharacterized protein LOC9638804 [Selaginella moellendorffii]|uniref:uncharacterized protein LOC9638804 n=1 Tax=Selaginella moellendorffii TaxID=88036 RepID=UPI000D1C5F9A|nr:uncharacterized protein LOC9638804 [Selaginella moellendorffii]|eukprot:XP_002977164.2 uncharacterized protein LOC9638804 [Selaginella moellendorffii]
MPLLSICCYHCRPRHHVGIWHLLKEPSRFLEILMFGVGGDDRVPGHAVGLWNPLEDLPRFLQMPVLGKCHESDIPGVAIGLVNLIQDNPGVLDAVALAVHFNQEVFQEAIVAMRAVDYQRVDPPCLEQIPGDSARFDKLGIVCRGKLLVRALDSTEIWGARYDHGEEEDHVSIPAESSPRRGPGQVRVSIPAESSPRLVPGQSPRGNPFSLTFFSFADLGFGCLGEVAEPIWQENDDIQATGRQEDPEIPEEHLQAGRGARIEHQKGQRVPSWPNCSRVLHFRGHRLSVATDH